MGCSTFSSNSQSTIQEIPAVAALDVPYEGDYGDDRDRDHGRVDRESNADRVGDCALYYKVRK